MRTLSIFTVLALIGVTLTAHADYDKNDSPHSLTGTFEIESIEQAKLKCQLDKMSKRIEPIYFNAIGCFVTVRLKSIVSNEKKIEVPHAVYGTGKACEMKAGEVVRLRILERRCGMISTQFTCESSPKPKILRFDPSSPHQATCMSGLMPISDIQK